MLEKTLANCTCLCTSTRIYIDASTAARWQRPQTAFINTHIYSHSHIHAYS